LTDLICFENPSSNVWIRKEEEEAGVGIRVLDIE
jgi:hypothetical protein